jgi:hypothetical protein
MANTEERLHNWRPIKQGVRMGDGNILEATKCGSITSPFEDPETRREPQFESKELKYVPGLWRNLFNISQFYKRESVWWWKGKIQF